MSAMVLKVKKTVNILNKQYTSNKEARVNVAE